MICSRCGRDLTTTAGCPNPRCWDEPPKHPYRCPVCNGTGKVWPTGDTTKMEKQPCSACNGTGIVWG